jgi:hypothetical protein
MSTVGHEFVLDGFTDEVHLHPIMSFTRHNEPKAMGAVNTG